MEENRLPLCYLDTPVCDKQVILEKPFVIDMAAGQVITPECLVIQNGRITHIGNRVDTDAQYIDTTGKFIIPGLWDMHVHTISSADFAFPQFLAHGVTGIRDMGSDLTNTVEWQYYQDIKPRISFAGPILDGFIPPFCRLFAETAQDVQIQITSVIKAGADLVKIHNMLPREAFFAAAERCRKEGVPLCGHVPFSVTAFEAIEAGQKTIEHMQGIPFAVSSEERKIREELKKVTMAGPESMELEYLGWQTRDEEKFMKLVDAIKMAGVFVTPTLIAIKSILAVSWDTENPLLHKYPAYIRKSIQEHNTFYDENPQMQQMMAFGQKLLETGKEMTRALNNAGVSLLAGTDGVFTHGPLETLAFFGEGLQEELELLVEVGLSPYEALKTATVHPAKYLGVENRLGSIEPGKLADMVILSGNPLENISNIRKIEAVVLGGKFINRNELDTL